MRVRPMADLRDERFHDAFPELGRLLMRRPPKSRPWRDFWKVWIPSFTLLMVAFAVLGTTPFSPLGLAVLVAGMLVVIVIGKAFRRLGIIDDPGPEKRS
jgi:peptidoglycan/LPS O-acetylase OafA/YrhL